MLKNIYAAAAVIAFSLLMMPGSADATRTASNGTRFCPTSEEYMLCLDEPEVSSSDDESGLKSGEFKNSLTPFQLERCASLKRAYTSSVAAKMENLSPLQHALCHLLTDRDVNQPAIMELHGKITALENELSLTRLNFFMDVEALLNSNQRSMVQTGFLLPVLTSTDTARFGMDHDAPSLYEVYERFESGRSGKNLHVGEHASGHVARPLPVFEAVEKSLESQGK